MYSISPLKDNQLSIVRDLAFKIWPNAYGQILSSEQLEYMLNKFYSIDALVQQLQKGQCFFIIEDNSEAIGFLAYEINCNESNQLKIHKIYVLDTYQGKGVGRLLIDFAIETAKRKLQKGVFLNVNKFNKAQFFYEKLGFTIVKDEVIDIGNNFVMDDYVMELPLF
ncbi:Putative acetyltransferase, GNAT family [Flavobacterium indicum GPTSA100-9 = DSM 17447]|uniref:Putative acetyltransferase, GNAT family n=1 Tax=Flavobacterium indicum (strain DSM 17447 / CIP 109464 / GPTSA100-9) TaxID=1094466 RepID=H8XVV6_FLAIG|nr:GNAT family N-acetyltransferase [Flavobacterium indicum]CCG54070.1 Putative acetyltransferase, GNAT family [Flavobacterium indicum GPTSA100-9 = DSM 17447]